MYLKPQIFSDNEQIVAGFSTRAGGVSPAPFESLNLGLSTEDRPENVQINRQRLFESVGFSVESLAITGQVHGIDLIEVDAPGLYAGYDAIITRKEGILLCLSAADCASVLFCDPRHGIVGACHAGWRGTAGRIVEKTVEALLERGASLEALNAYVSPCISLDHFEVGVEVAERFDAAFVRTFPGKSRPHVDLKMAIQAQLQEKGLAERAIEISPHCTYGQRDAFFSYRAEKGKTGRHMGFIGMKP